jgi:hypothetical protein
MVGGGASPADEQLVARFSGRLDDRVGRFVGRPHADQWVWDEILMLTYRVDADTAFGLLRRHSQTTAS